MSPWFLAFFQKIPWWEIDDAQQWREVLWKIRSQIIATDKYLEHHLEKKTENRHSGDVLSIKSLEHTQNLVAAGAALTDLQLRRAQLPLRLGGCGLRSAHRSRLAAYWASWADTLPILHSRLPLVADRLLQLLNGEAPPTTTQHPRRLPGSPAPPEQRGDCPTLGIYHRRPPFLARRPDPGRFPAGVATRHQCSPGLGRARRAPIWPFPSGARASPLPGWPTQRPRSHHPSYQPGIPARQPAFPHLAATAAPSPLELRSFPMSVWLDTRPSRRPPCRMRHHWRPPGTSCAHRTRGRPHLPRGRCPRRGQRAALAHEPRGPGHRRTPDWSPRKRLAALARGSAGSRRDPRQPPWPHRTGAPRFRREPGRGDPGSLPAQAGTHLPRVFRLAPLPPNHLGSRSRRSLGRGSRRLPPSLGARPRPHCASTPPLGGSSGLRAPLGRPPIRRGAARPGRDSPRTPGRGRARRRWGAPAVRRDPGWRPVAWTPTG